MDNFKKILRRQIFSQEVVELDYIFILAKGIVAVMQMSPTNESSSKFSNFLIEQKNAATAIVIANSCNG